MSNREKVAIVLIALILSLAILALLFPLPASGSSRLDPLPTIDCLRCQRATPTATNRPTPTPPLPEPTATNRPTAPAPTM